MLHTPPLREWKRLGVHFWFVVRASSRSRRCSNALSTGCPPSPRKPAMPTPPRVAPKSRAGWRVSSRYARGSTPQGARSSFWCVGDGRGDTEALGKLEVPNTVCCVRTRKDSRGCALPKPDPSGRGRRRVYSDRQWTLQQKWRVRTGWRRAPIEVRGRALRLLVKGLGPCRRVRWGARVFFVILVRGRHKRKKPEKSRAPMAFWVHAVSDGQGGWQLPVPLEMLLTKLWQRWEMEVGFRQLKSGVGLGQKPCWGFDSGARGVAWSAWVYGALMWSGYRAWGGWTGGARWGGVVRKYTMRYTFREVGFTYETAVRATDRAFNPFILQRAGAGSRRVGRRAAPRY